MPSPLFVLQGVDQYTYKKKTQKTKTCQQEASSCCPKVISVDFVTGTTGQLGAGTVPAVGPWLSPSRYFLVLSALGIKHNLAWVRSRAQALEVNKPGLEFLHYHLPAVWP